MSRIKTHVKTGDQVKVIAGNEKNKTGKIMQRDAYKQERDHLTLPRITFTHTRHKYGLVRRLIDRINEFEPADA